ncbi:MAG: FAD-binding oxidoreductase [Candidatus Methanofastidiosa archaeon]|nr:FAD-binding oxidoreductase [Candidatus Methanofastidiosa archaeon]
MSDIFIELKNALGEERVSTNIIDLFPYSRDWSPMYHEKDYLPEAVCVPLCTDDICKIMKIALKYRKPVIAWGGGTGMGGDNLAVKGGIVIATRSMSRILELDETNYTLTVEAGATIESINDFLEPRGLWFPHDPESKPASTIGAAMMCDNDGTFGIKYGGIVDYLLNCVLVLSNGEKLRVGQRKAASTSSGYKTMWLLIGSEGTLATVTEMTIRVFPLPRHRYVMLWLTPTMQDAVDALYEIHKSGVWLESAHVNDGYRLDYYTQAYREKTGMPAKIPEGFGSLLALTIAGDEDVVNFQKGKITAIMEKMKYSLLDNEEIVRGWWASKHTLQWERNKWPSGQKQAKFGAADVAVPPGRINEIYDAYIRYTEKYKLKKVGAAIYNSRPHVSPSISFAVYVDDHDKESVDNFFSYVHAMSKEALGLEGTMSSYIGDGIRLRRLTRLEHEKGLDIMWNIKKIFDPDLILNPGKIFPKEFDPTDYEV